VDDWIIDQSEKEVVFTYKGKEVVVKVKPLTWSKKNQILSNCMSFTSKEGGARFNMDAYNKECLMYMITNAPWGKTTAIFLSQIDDDLGAKLQKLVPGPFSGDEDEVKNTDFLEVKPEES